MDDTPQLVADLLLPWLEQLKHNTLQPAAASQQENVQEVS